MGIKFHNLLILKKESRPTFLLGYAVLTGRVRENAKETFAYFKEQDVTVKVISGDNARTVSEIAKQAGIENADKFVDAAMLVTDEQLARAAETYTVFGRVTPAQKQKLVQAMQKAGHTVATFDSPQSNSP